MQISIYSGVIAVVAFTPWGVKLNALAPIQTS